MAARAAGGHLCRGRGRWWWHRGSCWWWCGLEVGDGGRGGSSGSGLSATRAATARAAGGGPDRGPLGWSGWRRSGDGSGGACPTAPALGARRATRMGSGRAWLLLRPWAAAWVGLGGLPVSWRLHGGSMDLSAATAGFSGIGLSAFGPSRPSPHLLVSRTLLPSKGWSSPSCGPPLVSRPMPKDRARLAHDAAGPSSTRARCSRTDLVPLSLLQDRAHLALGAAGWVGGC
nr:spidroin-1-like [Aegilops tauschii subsp. strangulata]